MAAGTIVAAIHRPLRETITNPDTEARLRALADEVVFNEGEAPWTPAELHARLNADVRAVITCWGSPRIDAAALDLAPNLEIVGHAAGSVRPYVTREVWGRGVRVTHAADVIAEAVAEYTIGAILVGLRGFVPRHAAVSAGQWKDPVGGTRPGGLLAGRRVGVVAASMVGRRVIPLLHAFTPDVALYDPHVDEAQAADMDVELLELDALLASSDVVTLHAPILPETRRMIGRRELALLTPGALLVNCARAWLVDQQAMAEALQAGRISAVLDVFDDEPTPDVSMFRGLPNVVMTPHVAGFTEETRPRQLAAVVDDVERHFSGHPLMYEVRREALDRMA